MKLLELVICKLCWIFIKILSVIFHNKVIPDEIIKSFEYLTGGFIHYSQEGEDIIISRDIKLKDGFFIDVGAHHPIRFSNTYGLYRQGWRGINIDINPGSMDCFNRLRPNDKNLEVAVSDNTKPIDFYRFSESAYNTLCKGIAEGYINAGIELVDTIKIKPYKLSEILDLYCPEKRPINLLSIDVEGHEIEVLRSNNWEKYSPEWIIIEALNTSIEKLIECETIRYLTNLGYSPIHKLDNSIILRKMIE